MPFGIMVHAMHDDVHPEHQGSSSSQCLHDIIDHYGDRLRSASEFLERAKCRQLDDTDVVLTFDDRLRSQFDVAFPVLNERGVTAFFFVSTRLPIWETVFWDFRARCYPDSVDEFYEDFDPWILKGGKKYDRLAGYLKEYDFYTAADRRFRFLRDCVCNFEDYRRRMLSLIYLNGFELSFDQWITDVQLQALKSCGHIIGSHTRSHCGYFDNLSVAEQRDEWNSSKTDSVSLDVVAYPFGRGGSRGLSEDTKIAFRSHSGFTDGDLLSFPRKDCANIL